MRSVLPLAAAAATLALLAPAASAGTACGDIHGGFVTGITATGPTCKEAKRIAERWYQKAVKQGQGPVDMYVGSYYCNSRATGPEHVRTVCAAGTNKIRWSAGP